MESKNNVIIVLLIILIGVLSGLGLLFGIGNAVGVAVGPMSAKISEMAVIQQHMAENPGSVDVSSIMKRLDAIDQKLGQMQDKMGKNTQPAPSMPQPPSEDYNKVYDIPLGASAIIGKKDAPVTIVEFSDFQCPYCGKFHPVIEEVLKAYPNQVRLIIKNYPLPFHPNAMPAAKLAWAANEQGGKFGAMAALLLENGGNVSEDKIKEYAKKLGLNYNTLMSDYKNKDAQWQKLIQADMNLADAVDVRGTPTFFLNGKKTMARDLNTFKSQIDAILAADKK